jgi:hypothetical protein
MKNRYAGNSAAIVAAIMAAGSLSPEQVSLAEKVASRSFRPSPEPVKPVPYDGSTRQQRRAMDRMNAKRNTEAA